MPPESMTQLNMLCTPYRGPFSVLNPEYCDMAARRIEAEAGQITISWEYNNG